MYYFIIDCPSKIFISKLNQDLAPKKFTWMNDDLMIKFDDESSMLTDLKKVNPLEHCLHCRVVKSRNCFYMGKILQSDGAYITVTNGCPGSDNYLVTFFNLEMEHTSYKVVNGSIVPDMNPKGWNGTDIVVPLKGFDFPFIEHLQNATKDAHDYVLPKYLK